MMFGVATGVTTLLMNIEGILERIGEAIR